jgi:hypothetical protein
MTRVRKAARQLRMVNLVCACGFDAPPQKKAFNPCFVQNKSADESAPDAKAAAPTSTSVPVGTSGGPPNAKPAAEPAPEGSSEPLYPSLVGNQKIGMIQALWELGERVMASELNGRDTSCPLPTPAKGDLFDPSLVRR